MLLDVHNDSLKNRSNSIAVTCRNVGRNPKGLNPSAGSSHIKLKEDDVWLGIFL